MGKLNDLICILDTTQKVFIQPHDFPDPDALSSCWGLEYLLKLKNVECEICYTGGIEKFTTRKLIDKLNVKITDIADIVEMNEKSNIILVDTQKTNSNTQDFIGDEVACIDHHADNGINYRYKDVRPTRGSCASIITEYFIEENIEIPKNIATALLFGIKMDTLDFTRGVDLYDIKMYEALYGSEDEKILQELQMDKFLMEDIRTFSAALNQIKLIKDICFVNVGYNCPEAMLAAISDFILSIEEINFAIAYSCKTVGVKLSVRSQIGSLDAGEIISEALKGIGFGGGHKEMAGGLIPKKNLNLLNQYMEEFIEESFLKVIYLKRNI